MLSLGASVLALTLTSIWQHDSIMSRAMKSIMGVEAHGEMMLWMIVPPLVSSLALILAAVMIFLIQPVRGDSGVIGLTERERAIVDYLADRGGWAEQREISKELGLTRLQTHRVILSLRKRGIVETEPHGRTNIVKLKTEKTNNTPNH